MFSLRFRSVAEMAGWDEEALLIASLVVEDTPDRQIKNKRRTNLHSKTPPTNSRIKRRAQRRSLCPIPMIVLNLDSDDESSKQGCAKEKKESKKKVNIDKKMGDVESEKMESPGSDIPYMDRLREEFSCAICLEIYFEPSTTSCGHRFYPGVSDALKFASSKVYIVTTKHVFFSTYSSKR